MYINIFLNKGEMSSLNLMVFYLRLVVMYIILLIVSCLRFLILVLMAVISSVSLVLLVFEAFIAFLEILFVLIGLVNNIWNGCWLESWLNNYRFWLIFLVDLWSDSWDIGAFIANLFNFFKNLYFFFKWNFPIKFSAKYIRLEITSL